MQTTIIMRICAKCKENKPLTDFVKDNRKSDGYGYRCKDCHRLAEKGRTSTPEGKESKKQSGTAYRQANSEQLNIQKTVRKAEGVAIINGFKCQPCMDCNRSYPSDCMELDHVRDEKLLNVSAMKSMNRDRLLQEIAKCEVVCAVCHRIRTENRRVPTKDKRLLDHRIMINEFKSIPCTDCGVCFSPVGMDLDHVRGEKVIDISNMGHYPRWRVLEELSKCEVVCANCHRLRTKSRIISRS